MPVWLAVVVLGVLGVGVASAVSRPAAPPPSVDRGPKRRPAGSGAGASSASPSASQGEAALRAAGWRSPGVGVARQAVADGWTWPQAVAKMGVFPLEPLKSGCDESQTVGETAGGAALALALVPLVGPLLATAAGIVGGMAATSYAECVEAYEADLKEYNEYRAGEADLARERLGV